MGRLRYNWNDARAHLSNSCSALAPFIQRLGSARYHVRDAGDLFQALARSIIYQQLSGKAAASIHARFVALFGTGRPNSAEALSIGFAPLRGAGLSRSKTLSILDLAAKEREGFLPEPRKLGRMPDDEIIACLSRVRGIGPWTAQMHLIFYLGRPDVMPATDLGIQRGVRNVYGLKEVPTPDEVLSNTEHLAPYRSAAAWYFWRASETGLPAG